MVEFDVYEYSIIHMGMEVVFHHPKSEKLRLSRDTENKYGLDKEHARIFMGSASEQTFNAEEMLADYIKSSGKRLGEHILFNLVSRLSI